MASGSPDLRTTFAKTFPKLTRSLVLLLVTILGVVEFFLFLLAQYYPDYDKGRKKAFSAVHFALFETAILNAFMSACTAFVAMRVSQRIWVETELLEVNHYVEIREEFERIDESNRNYHTLKLQIRFHELRVQFLKSYNLPLQLKISDYLIRSEQAVLIKLVHISPTAWLQLTGAVCLLYLVCGHIYYQTRSQTLMGLILVSIFFASIMLFIIISLALYRKMRSIFRTILNEKWVLAEGQEKERLAAAQLALFWGSNPRLVIHIIQFMQFGYAVSIATVVIFWKEIAEGPVPSYVYLLAVLICYAIFVVITGRVIPRYTLCTSLGQLVDESRLRETVALFRLEEAKQKQLDLVAGGYDDTIEEHGDHVKQQDSSISAMDQLLGPPLVIPVVKDKGVDKVGELPSLDADAFVSERRARMERRRERRKSVSDGVVLMTMLNAPVERSRSEGIAVKKAGRNRVDTGDLLAELVTLDTEALRSMVPETSSERKMRQEKLRKQNGMNTDVRTQETTEERTQRHQNLRMYGRKTASAGVSTMRLVDPVFDDTDAPPEDSSSKNDDTNSVGPRTRRRVKSTSGGVAAMFSFGSTETNQQTKRGRESTRVTFQDSLDKIDSNATADGYVSDEDNLPAFAPRSDANKILPPLRKRLQEFFLSPRYVFLSNVFGTIVAFLLIGKRIEGFVHSQSYVSKDFVSLALPNVYSFWILIGWLALCLSTSLLIVYLNWQKNEWKPNELTACVAAGIDAALFTTCGTFLLVGKLSRLCSEHASHFVEAEGQRCCNIEGTARLLASEKIVVNAAELCSCSQFGSRVYGGLGPIEPFTALVCLRILRFWLANLLVSKVSTTFVKESSLHVGSAATTNLESGCDGGVEIRSGEAHKHKKSRVLPAAHLLMLAEVWEQTVRDNPDIVQIYGEFSGEILRSMLGVEQHAYSTDAKRGGTSAAKESESSVKSTSDTIPVQKYGHSSRLITQLTIGNAQTNQDWDNITQPSQGIAFPNARLVRSMRRCDRKLLPILDEWTVVDVAVTHLEIVYFDATDVDDSSSHQDALLEITRNAFVSTKGGKGLRLADAAKGRRVVGRMLLQEIATVFVERFLPGSAPIESPAVEVALVEFWTKQNDQTSCTSELPRAEQWHSHVQDQLQITTSSGQTLCLRFYSDLEDAKSQQRNDGAAKSAHRNNALSWALTIVRFCGPDQLKQVLLSLGQDNDAEIAELLRINHYGNESMPNRRNEGLLRQLSKSPRRVFHRSSSQPFQQPTSDMASINLCRKDSIASRKHKMKRITSVSNTRDIETGPT
jgi:hypothetical protein